MSHSVSVITCAHNPRPAYLELVLKALANQTLEKSSWEYLLIDNGSTESLASWVDLSWHPSGQHISEDRLGLTHARLRGIERSSSDILVFVDDDNVLDPNYLTQVIKLANAWPHVGAFSGQVRPQFEELPGDWTRPYWNRLAIREFENDRWSNIACLPETAPNGAGLCVRRDVASRYAQYHSEGRRRFLLDRQGSDLLSAGDLDLAATACDIGLGNALFASLGLTHLVPKERLNEEYLLRLMEGQTFSAVILNSFRSNSFPRVQPGLITRVMNGLRLIRMKPRNRRFFLAEQRGLRKAATCLSREETPLPRYIGLTR
jgi:glycosyltransferase involved in cell wall biosynthesis